MSESIEWQDRRPPGWPSPKPVWSLAALWLGVLTIPAAFVYQYKQQWTVLERAYLGNYIRSAIPFPRAIPYKFLHATDKKGVTRWVVESEIIEIDVPGKDGATIHTHALSDEAVSAGEKQLQWRWDKYDSAKLHDLLRRWLYKEQSVAALMMPAGEWGLGVFVVLLGFAIPCDYRRRVQLRYGRRDRGPVLIERHSFNRKRHGDGVGFVTKERQTLRERLSVRYAGGPMIMVPRVEESSHFLIMGDSGTGKSALIRQLLMQIADHNEPAIVYDPALEYTPQFYQPERGDLILNPLDARTPYWSPGDEVKHHAEAMTLAASLFPERYDENRFFVESPRKIFAHLLTFHPSPQELTRWMCQPEEIDKRVAGTELAALIDPCAPAQRSGVLGSLNLVADAFRLLPKEDEVEKRWSAAEWSQKRRGWLFLTSTPEMRERLRPLVSLWLDLLVLRMMNQSVPETQRDPRPAWFVLDELASLQKLPQLHTALTENRKSNNPVVLGLQGRSQLEARYGHEAEAMFSQPATKIFLRTSEPRAAKWISDSIGEVRLQLLRESRTSGWRDAKSYALETRTEPLVMPSEITGLQALCGYLKSGNYVVRMSFPYYQLDKKEPGFIERKMDAPYAPLQIEVAASSGQRGLKLAPKPVHQEQRVFMD